MTYPLSETFDDALGRWDGYAPFDATEAFDALKGFLTTQEHVDLRSFREIGDLLAAPQFPDLDTVPQTDLDAETQTEMETDPGLNTAEENWTLSGTGLTSLVVGATAARGGWSGATMATDGNAIAADLVSSMTLPIDISAMDELTAIFPDYNTFDGTSYVQLTSAADGSFGTAADNSAQVAFSTNGSIMPELRFNVSAFSTGAGASFSLAAVTGVKIHLVAAAAPTSGLTSTVMAIRAVKTSWTESALDFDTRIGAICVPVTLTGSLYTGAVASGFQFVRGDGTKEDPIPMNLAMNMYFQPGGRTSPNDATGSVFNVIGFILREQKIAGVSGSHIQARLKFNDTSTTFEVVRVDQSGTSDAETNLNSVLVGGPLDGTQRYILRVEARGTQIDATIYETDSDHNQGSVVWRLGTTITDESYEQRNGRVGFVAGLVSRDAFIDGIDVAPTGFAELQTQRYNSRSPVDGAQLAAVFSPDINLWSSYTGADLAIDQTKTVSGNGSYRTALGITTNSFVVDDWTETYLQLALWVPSGVTMQNQPRILLNTSNGTETLPMPTLQPSQWNDLYFDLGIFRNLLTADGYSFTVAPAVNPDTPLGFYWVDSTVVGRRRVAWSIRATANGLFRNFKNNVNNPGGAVHLAADERGTELQLQAIALTEDAWVSSFQLFPRFAELGLPVYDQGYEKR